MSGNLLWIPVTVYFVAWLAGFAGRWNRPSQDSGIVQAMLVAGWLAHTFLVAAALLSGGWSLSVLLGATAWALMIAYNLAWRSGRLRPLSLVLLPLAIALLFSSILTSQATLLREGPGQVAWLWRNLLTAHIVALLAGHLLFAIACLGSIAYLLQERQLKQKAQLGLRLPPLGALESLTHRSVGLGFVFLSVGLLLGLAVAGAENLAVRLAEWRLIIPFTSWVVYAGFLVVYDFRGQRGRFGAIWSIAGFTVVLASLVFELAVLAGGGH